MSYDAEVLADAPVAYWKLEETGANPTIVDSSGNGRDGTFTGTVAQSLGLATGNCIDHDGSSHKTQVPNHSSLQITGSLTLEAWVRKESAAATQDVLTKSVFGVSGSGYALYWVGLAPIFELYRAASGGDLCAGLTGLPIGATVHMVGVYDAAAQTMDLYLNGEIGGTQKTAIAAPISNTADVGIGSWIDGAVSEWWNGKIDSVAIYNTALSQARVRAHFNAREVPPDPQVWTSSTPPSGTGAGTAAASPLSVPYPATNAAAFNINYGDLVLLHVGLKPDTATITTPTGFVAVNNGAASGGSGTTGLDTGPVKAAWFYRICDGTESGNISVTLGSSPNAAMGTSFLVRPTPGGSYWSIEGANGVDTTTGTPFTAAMGQNPGLETNDLVMVFGCIPTDVTTPSQFSAETLTATGITSFVSEWSEPETTQGNDMGGVVCNCKIESGPATGVPTFSATAGGTTTNVAGPIVMVRVRCNPQKFSASTVRPVPQIAAVGRAASY